MFLDFDFKINLDVSKAVTKEEWADVYNESLKLIEVFPLLFCKNTVPYPNQRTRGGRLGAKKDTVMLECLRRYGKLALRRYIPFFKRTASRL